MTQETGLWMSGVHSSECPGKRREGGKKGTVDDLILGPGVPVSWYRTLPWAGEVGGLMTSASLIEEGLGQQPSRHKPWISCYISKWEDSPRQINKGVVNIDKMAPCRVSSSHRLLVELNKNKITESNYKEQKGSLPTGLWSLLSLLCKLIWWNELLYSLSMSTPWGCSPPGAGCVRSSLFVPPLQLR